MAESASGGAKSLQDLSAEKLLKQLLASEHADSEYTTLEPRTQEILFSRLRKEHIQLQREHCTIKKIQSNLEHYCPQTDLQVFSGPNRIKLLYDDDEGGENDDGDDSDGHAEPEVNGYELQGLHYNEWSYFTSDSVSGDQVLQQQMRHEERMMHQMLQPQQPQHDMAGGDAEIPPREAEPNLMDNLISWASHEIGFDTTESDWIVLKPYDSLDKRYRYLHDRISSQLFYYRLTATFGMPPAEETDGYKSCWTVHLRSGDGVSTLNLYDYKGGPSLRFRGTREGSIKALSLLNFLTSMNCPHTYDGIVAGTFA